MVIRKQYPSSLTNEISLPSINRSSPFQEFCLNSFPRILERNDYKSFFTDLELIFKNNPNLLVTSYNPQALKLLILDLVFIKQAASHKQWQLPQGFNLFVDQICQENRRLPILLYEDCILINPPQPFTRLFSTDRVRNSENLFISTHQKIEQKLAKIIDNLELFNYLAPKSFNCAKTQTIAFDYGQKSIELLKSTRLELANLKTMPLEHFATFRNYYKSLPGTDTFGPSGRFSAKFFIARILVNGCAITNVVPNFFAEILENLDYFPSQDRDKLVEVIANTQADSRTISCTTNIEVILQEVAPNQTYRRFVSLAKSIGTLLDQMLGVHLGLVHRYVVPLSSQTLEPNKISSSQS